MNIFLESLKLLKGIAAFFIIWLICLAASPIFLVIIAGKYAQDFLKRRRASEKEEKIVDAPKDLWYVPATKDSDSFSAN